MKYSISAIIFIFTFIFISFGYSKESPELSDGNCQIPIISEDAMLIVYGKDVYVARKLNCIINDKEKEKWQMCLAKFAYSVDKCESVEPPAPVIKIYMDYIQKLEKEYEGDKSVIKLPDSNEG